MQELQGQWGSSLFFLCDSQRLTQMILAQFHDQMPPESCCFHSAFAEFDEYVPGVVQYGSVVFQSFCGLSLDSVIWGSGALAPSDTI